MTVRGQRPVPEWTPPMLATLTERRFSDPAWVFEPKLDGYRCLAFREGSRVRLLSRNRIPLTADYPEVARALLGEKPRAFVVDGEIVAFRDGLTSFSELQRRTAETPVFYYVFDLLHLGGEDLRARPLLERKRRLREAFRLAPPLAYVSHEAMKGEALYAGACRSGWEGIIAKRADAPYSPRRSADWLKFKCVNSEDFVIAGYTDPGGSRSGFGALLLGYRRDGRFVYAGKVGTGYTEKTLRSLKSSLVRLETPKPPFDGPPPRVAGAHWVRPRLVAQVEFTEWTRDGRLRHPSFSGLRRDKAPAQVAHAGP